MRYELYLRREALDFLHEQSSTERLRLLNLLEELARNPFRTSEFTAQDKRGREVQVSILGRYAVYYCVDHAVREVRVVDIEEAA